MRRYISLVAILAVITVIFGTIEVVAQQNLRMGANDPQIQLAEDAAQALDAGKSPASMSQGIVNMDKSLAPFIIVYNKQGYAISGNGYLDGVLPTIPFGVLQASRGQDYNFVTWQPNKDVRIASITVAAQKYYVTSGRNIREIGGRVQQTMQLAAFGWLVSAAIVLAGHFLVQRSAKK